MSEIVTVNQYKNIVDGTIYWSYPSGIGINPPERITAPSDVPTDSGSTVSYLPREILKTLVPSPGTGKSFNQHKKSGDIKMTPYHRGLKVIDTHLVELPQYSKKSTQPAYILPGEDPVVYGSPRNAVSTWIECITYDRLAAILPVYSISSDNIEELESAINKAQSAVIADAQSSFDALTTLAESREALELIINALKTISKPLKLFKLAASTLNDPKKIASTWLQYRYGIMPLIYTIQDGLKILDEKNFIFNTCRSRENIIHSGSSKPSFSTEDNFIFETISGETTVRATTKARYSSSSLRLADQINFNPFLTGWELVPFSFVVDWALNVGELIQAQTLSLLDLAEERVSCYSVKIDTLTNSYYHRHKVWDNRFTYPSSDAWNRGGIQIGSLTTENEEYLIKSVTETSYSRFLFSPSDISLDLNLDLNWKRLVDVISLSLNQTKTDLRLLK